MCSVDNGSWVHLNFLAICINSITFDCYEIVFGASIIFYWTVHLCTPCHTFLLETCTCVPPATHFYWIYVLVYPPAARFCWRHVLVHTQPQIFAGDMHLCTPNHTFLLLTCTCGPPTTSFYLEHALLWLRLQKCMAGAIMAGASHNLYHNV